MLYAILTEAPWRFPEFLNIFSAALDLLTIRSIRSLSGQTKSFLFYFMGGGGGVKERKILISENKKICLMGLLELFSSYLKLYRLPSVQRALILEFILLSVTQLII